MSYTPSVDLSPDDLNLLHRLLDGHTLATREANATIDRLTAHGCAFEKLPHGIRLRQAGLSVWRDYLDHRLHLIQRPRHVTIYRETTSTQDTAKRMGATPCVVATDHQSRGRGRLGRAWSAPPGSAVLFSLNTPLRPESRTTDTLGLIAAVALTRAIDELTQTRNVGIKWPNDLMVGSRKLAGILIETQGDTAVIGVGVNVGLTAAQKRAMPDDVRQRVATLQELGAEPDRLRVLTACVAALLEALEQSDAQLDELTKTWRARNVMDHQHLSFLTAGHPVAGTVLDIDAHEGLLLRRDSGELIHLPAATTSVVG